MMPDTGIQVPITADLLGLPLAAGVRTGSGRFGAQNWMLIGVLMIKAHAIAASISAVRPTDDVDGIVRLGTSRPNALTAVTQGLRELYYSPLGIAGIVMHSHTVTCGDREIIDLGKCRSSRLDRSQIGRPPDTAQPDADAQEPHWALTTRRNSSPDSSGSPLVDG